MPASIVQPRQMLIGAGAIKQLVPVLQKMGLKRPFIVTDTFMVECGNVARITQPLTQADMEYAVFSDTVPDPTSDSIDRGVQALAQHSPDCVIALGGGSPIDSAKAMAFLATYGGHMRDYKVPVANDVPGLPMVAIPTTAGTGSEATRFTIVTDEATDEKMLCTGVAFCPTVALIDYELTLSKPRRLTADTGLDTLTHAIEAYVSAKHNPYSDGLAQLAMTALGQHLRHRRP